MEMINEVYFSENESSALQKVMYNEETMELTVYFRRGVAYVYQKVPPKVFENFLNSPMKSKYFIYVIRGYYEYRKLR